MTFLISYFYQLRFFPQNTLPISTAKWDPKWFHDFKTQSHIFRDKHSIVNGVRCEDLMFPEEWFKELEKEGCACEKECKQTPPCKFMSLYRKYLDSLDFDNIITHLENKAKRFQCDTIVLMVHEPTSCKCAERPVLVDWFKSHNIELKEFSKSLY